MMDQVEQAEEIKTRRPVGRRHPLVGLLPFAAMIAAVILIPIFVFKPSAQGQNYDLSILILIGINAIVAVGLNLLMGYAGQVSLGHAAFYGIGAYVSAILTTQHVPAEVIAPMSAVVGMMAAAAAVLALLRVESFKLGLSAAGFIVVALLALRFGTQNWIPYTATLFCLIVIPLLCRVSAARLAVAYVAGALSGFVCLKLLNHVLASGISPWYAMIAGALFACLVAYLLGVQALRLQGYYLAMATLGFGVIIGIILLQWDAVTGGTSGIYAIPTLSIAGKQISNHIRMYWLVFTILIVVAALSANIVNSRVGRAFRAVHGSETAAAALGVDTARYKVQVFVLSAALGAVAGSLYAHYVTFISPEPFGFKYSIELVVMVVVGGLGSVWGAIFGAGAITWLGSKLSGLPPIPIRGQEVPIADFDVAIFGVILMLIMIYAPKGLVPGIVDAAKAFSGLIRRKPSVSGEKEGQCAR